MAPVIKQESTEPTAKRTKRDYINSLKVIVGPQDNEFIIHTEFATAKSSLFKAATSERWIEGQERIVRLPEQEVEAFEVFVHWIYTGSLDFANMDETGTISPPSFLNCGKIWALAHYLGATQLQNQALDRMIHKVAREDGGNVSAASLKHIWQISPPSSNIRRLLTDIVASGNRGSNIEQAKDLPEDVILEAASRHFYGATKSMPTPKDRCNYHDHAEREPRCA